MHYEIKFPGNEEFVIGCRHCTNIALSRVHAAVAHPEPTAGPCELEYDGCEDKS